MREPRHRPARHQRGFSLVEISIVLIIAGLALGGLLAALGPQLAQRKYTDAQQQLKQVTEAVIAYAMLNRRLPCPASATSNGRESFCTSPIGACGAEVVAPATSAGQGRGRCFAAPNAGFVPAVTLGLGGLSTDGRLADPWARPLRYHANQQANTTQNNPAALVTGGACAVGASTCYPFTQADGIRNAYYESGAAESTPASLVFVCRSATGIVAANCGTAMQNANPAFVVYSYGGNGNVGALGVDEAANTNNDPVYVVHEKSEAGATNGEFDDLFEWATLAQLIARMQGNGVLP